MGNESLEYHIAVLAAFRALAVAVGNINPGTKCLTDMPDKLVTVTDNANIDRTGALARLADHWQLAGLRVLHRPVMMLEYQSLAASLQNLSACMILDS
jgi:hypothetical protein